MTPTDRITFLGFTFKGTGIRWSDKAFWEFIRQEKRLTGRSWFVLMDYRFKKLTQYIRGWINYFGISEYYRPILELDHWLCRRDSFYATADVEGAEGKKPSATRLG